MPVLLFKTTGKMPVLLFKTTGRMPCYLSGQGRTPQRFAHAS